MSLAWFAIGVCAGIALSGAALVVWALRGIEPIDFAPRPIAGKPDRFMRCGVCRSTYPVGWWHSCRPHDEVARG